MYSQTEEMNARHKRSTFPFGAVKWAQRHAVKHKAEVPLLAHHSISWALLLLFAVMNECNRNANALQNQNKCTCIIMNEHTYTIYIYT